MTQTTPLSCVEMFDVEDIDTLKSVLEEVTQDH